MIFIFLLYTVYDGVEVSMVWTEKNILVVGLAKSGISAAVLCHALGARISVQDQKNREQLGSSIVPLVERNITMYLGEENTPCLAEIDLLIISPGVPTDLPFIQEARDQGIPVWSEVELAYVLCSCPIVAITGTNGKTTTTTLVGEIVKSFVSHTYVVGNIGIPFTDHVLSMKKEDWAVVEVSSFQLETIHTFHPTVSAVLNISPDHLNRHKTYESYIETKERIFMNQLQSDTCILNYDDLICRKMGRKMKCQPIYFSRQSILEEGVFLQQDKIFAVKNQNKIEICSIDELQILGNHNIENAMAAVAITLWMGIPVDNIRRVLIQFKGVEHRIEYVTTMNEVDYYNDSKGTNPGAAIPAIEAMRKPIILIGGGMDKGSDFTEWVEKFPGKVKYAIVFGETADQIQKTAWDQKYTCIEKVNSLEEAVHRAAAKASRGDCVLLSPACASWDMFESYEQRGKIFKDVVWSLSKELVCE